MKSIVSEWLARVRSASLLVEGDVEQLATANMIAFGISEDEVKSVGAGDLDSFLELAFREYALMLASAPGSFWFYAWHDEVSGTLQISATRALRPEELPFACRLNILDRPAPVTEAFVQSEYLAGIPKSELEESSWEDDEDGDGDFVLDVFVRLLPSSV